MALFGAFRRKPHEWAGFALYQAAVIAARDPWFYTALGVPDTMDGRFDLIALHATLLVHRLRDDVSPGPDLAQAIFDAMFSDMDNNLRELGLDMGVGKRVRAMWEAFNGRAHAYASALDAGDDAALAAALSRNVWRGGAVEGEHVQSLTSYVRRQFEALRRKEIEAFAAGSTPFEPAFA